MLKLLFRREDSYLRVTGWIDSMRTRQCRRADGSAVPWMNYAMLAFLDERLSKDFTVFEYGSGFSTDYFARNCRSVVSVEYNKEWYERVRSSASENARLIFVPSDTDGAYCRSIAKSGDEFDVVVVDGDDRVNCLMQAINALSKRGIILLDVSARPEYYPGFAFMAANGFRRLTFWGLKPTDSCFHATTVFYRDGNCLHI